MLQRAPRRGSFLRLPDGSPYFASLVLLTLAFLQPALAASPPPPAVTVATVQQHNVAPVHSFVGRVIAIESVQIVPRVTAFIDSVPVKEGTDVKAGQVIIELQKSQYQAAVQAAQAQLSSAQAALKNDQVAYERAARLSKQGFEARSNLDTAISTRDQAAASVNSAEANLAQAALNLSYCTIKSPINGRIGEVSLTRGNLVTPTTPALATINQLNPIQVVFSVSDSDIIALEQKTGHTQAEIAKGLSVTLKLPDGAPYPEIGKIAFLGNQVDQQTGTVPVYANFANPQDLLLPNAFVTVDVRKASPEERVLVPVAAVQTDQAGNYVLTVGTNNKVAKQAIVTGAQIAQNFVVKRGLRAGQRVIVQGVQKVHPGETVRATEAPPAPSGAQATAQGPTGTSGG